MSKPYDWRADMAKAARLREKSDTNRKKSSERLWRATKGGIVEWLVTTATEDSEGKGIYAEFLAAYGDKRQGDCSKMKAVALAVRDRGLDVEEYENLSQAYAAARQAALEEETANLTAEQDDAAEKAVARISETAPKKAKDPEGAAMLLLAGGIAPAVQVILDTLGPQSTDAHRALLRALEQDIENRVVHPTKEK